MRKSILNCLSSVFALLVIASIGCTPAKEPEGPADGSIQAYLDENPDVAARVDDDDTSGDDDGTGDSAE